EGLEAKLEQARSEAPSRGSAALKTFEMTRPSVAAQAVGIARAAFEFSRDYAKERTQFGRPIIDNQGVAFKLADMAMEIDAARLLTWRAAGVGRNGGQFGHAEGWMAKPKGGGAAGWGGERAAQV